MGELKRKLMGEKERERLPLPFPIRAFLPLPSPFCACRPGFSTGTSRCVRISQVSVLRVLSGKHMFYRC